MRWAEQSHSPKRPTHTFASGWFGKVPAMDCLSKIRPVLLRENVLSFRKMYEKTRFVVFWMGTVCNGKLSVGQVIWAWKMKKNPTKHRAKCFTVLRTRYSSGSTCLPSGLQQSPRYLCRGSLCLSLISGDYFSRLYYGIRGAG